MRKMFRNMFDRILAVVVAVVLSCMMFYPVQASPNNPGGCIMVEVKDGQKIVESTTCDTTRKEVILAKPAKKNRIKVLPDKIEKTATSSCTHDGIISRTETKITTQTREKYVKGSRFKVVITTVIKTVRVTTTL